MEKQLATRIPRYGEVWTVNLGESTYDEEDIGIKPCIVVSSPMLNKKGNIIVIPIARKKNPLDSHISVELDDTTQRVDGYFIVEHIRAISSNRLGKKIGKAQKHILSSINQQLTILCSSQTQHTAKTTSLGKSSKKGKKKRRY